MIGPTKPVAFPLDVALRVTTHRKPTALPAYYTCAADDGSNEMDAAEAAAGETSTT